MIVLKLFAGPFGDLGNVFNAHIADAYRKTDGTSESHDLKDLLGRKQETFQQQLLRLIDEKGYTDVEVYKRANVDRKLFSKIRSNPEYKPQKKTAMALAMALRLNMDETTDLLRLAGLALSPASLMDVIVGYCIENRIYDLFEVNALLFEYDQPLLG